MRQARAGSEWTATRPAHRVRYDAYITSDVWWVRRDRWFTEEQQRTGLPARCAVCDLQEGLDLHHLRYTAPGAEQHSDIVALCRRHHRHLHDVRDTSKEWRRLDLRAASLGLIASMRADRIARLPRR